MPARVDLKGQKFGRLTAVEPKGSKWLCHCDCGNQVEVYQGSLRKGASKSCGCLRRELTTSRNAKHGMSGTVEHECWKNMIQRCTNPKNPGYPDYGGRGIKVCERWLSFENFFADMGVRPEGCSLDRIAVEGDYEPANCRWATQMQQQRNRRNSVWVEGISLQLIADEVGIPYGTLYHRLIRAQKRQLTGVD